MPRPDDSSLTPQQLARVRFEAERALKKANAWGVFPTPVEAILEAACVKEVEEDVLNPSFVAKILGKAEEAGKVIKRALSKVLGLFHALDGLIFIDQTLITVKKRFIRLHEAGHGFLPWQRPMYAVVADCENSLDPQTADLFDREANVFASEVLFQLDAFSRLAEQHPFGIQIPLKLAPKFKASAYASIRQYVTKSKHQCAVLVLNMPELEDRVGFRSTLRRAVSSSTFLEKFGMSLWQSSFTPDDDIGAMIPLGHRRMSGKRSLGLFDLNGDLHECVAEAFTNTKQVFVLILVVKPCKGNIMPAASPQPATSVY